MIRIIIIIVLLIAAFVGGMLVQRMDQSDVLVLQQELQSRQELVARLETRNQELNDTLSIVKRQIQTDRIAYQSLQEVVDGSSTNQAALQQQLEQARQLLKQLRERLESQ